MMSRLQMIRLTQPEVVHDKKQQNTSSPDENTIKKEADAGTLLTPFFQFTNLVFMEQWQEESQCSKKVIGHLV